MIHKNTRESSKLQPGFLLTMDAPGTAYTSRHYRSHTLHMTNLITICKKIKRNWAWGVLLNRFLTVVPSDHAFCANDEIWNLEISCGTLKESKFPEFKIPNSSGPYFSLRPVGDFEFREFDSLNVQPEISSFPDSIIPHETWSLGMPPTRAPILYYCSMIFLGIQINIAVPWRLGVQWPPRKPLPAVELLSPTSERAPPNFRTPCPWAHTKTLFLKRARLGRRRCSTATSLIRPRDNAFTTTQIVDLFYYCRRSTGT